MRKKKNKASRLDSLLNIPEEISTNNPKVTILGFEHMVIENHNGILDYQDYFIRLNTYMGIININGYNLKLEEMTTDDIVVTGKIDSIDFENTVDVDDGED